MSYPLAAARGGHGAQSAAAPSSLLTGLVAYWGLGDLTAQVGGLTLTNSASPVTFVAGKLGNCGNFVSASAQKLTRADDAILRADNADKTWRAWVYLHDVTNPHTILSKYDGATTEYELRWEPSYNKIVWLARNGGNTASVNARWGTPLSVDTWYYVRAYLNSATGKIGISVNNGIAVETAITGGIYTGTGTFYVGALDANNPHEGRTDEVAIWDRLLTVDECAADYNGGAGLAYPF